MTSEEPNHPILDNDIKVNLPLDRQVCIHDILSCKEGIHNNIHVLSRNEDILIESRVDQNGSNDLKVFKNNQLIKHVVNGVNKLDGQQESKESTEQRAAKPMVQNSQNKDKPEINESNQQSSSTDLD